MGTYIKLLKKFEKNIEKKGLTITVSGLSGTGKTSFAKKLAELTGLKYMSAGKIFREIAKERNMPLEEFSKKREKGIDIMIDKKTLELAQKGGYVLDGRMTGAVAGDYADERVFIKARKELIAQRVAEREGKTPKQAIEDIKKRDKADTQKYLEIYGVEPEKMNIYTKIIENNGTYEGLMKKAELLAKQCLDKASK